LLAEKVRRRLVAAPSRSISMRTFLGASEKKDQGSGGACLRHGRKGKNPFGGKVVPPSTTVVRHRRGINRGHRLSPSSAHRPGVGSHRWGERRSMKGRGGGGEGRRAAAASIAIAVAGRAPAGVVSSVGVLSRHVRRTECGAKQNGTRVSGLAGALVLFWRCARSVVRSPSDDHAGGAAVEWQALGINSYIGRGASKAGRGPQKVAGQTVFLWNFLQN
jgi:hypothetical protein